MGHQRAEGGPRGGDLKLLLPPVGGRGPGACFSASERSSSGGCRLGPSGHYLRPGAVRTAGAGEGTEAIVGSLSLTWRPVEEAGEPGCRPCMPVPASGVAVLSGALSSGEGPEQGGRRSVPASPQRLLLLQNGEQSGTSGDPHPALASACLPPVPFPSGSAVSQARNLEVSPESPHAHPHPTEPSRHHSSLSSSPGITNTAPVQASLPLLARPPSAAFLPTSQQVF